MGTFLFYTFEVSFCLILFYFLFRILFRADTMFRFNRLLLLMGTVGCMLMPFIQLDISHGELWQHPISTVRSLLIENKAVHTAYPAEEAVNSVSTSRQEVTNGASSKTLVANKTSVAMPWRTIIIWLYMAGACTTLFYFLLSTCRMLRLIRRYPSSAYKGYHLIVCPERIFSFSWGNTIVLSAEDNERNAEEILLHERMHLRYKHTLDLLWMEALLVLQWFNPAVWLLMRDLRELHEYEADNGVLTHGIDATQYQLLLVKKSVGTRLYSMANGFNHSKLKNRINMMLKKRTSNRARLKLLLFVPVAAVTMYAFAQPEVTKTVEQVVKPESVVQDSLYEDSDWELLEQYFNRKRNDVWGENEPIKLKEKDVHKFFVNLNNKILLDNEYVHAGDKGEDVSLLRKQFTDILRKDYEQAVRNKHPFNKALFVQYDRGAQAGAIKNYLNTIKEVYLELRKEVATQMGGASEEQLDKIFPILVGFAEPKEYGELLSKNKKTPLPIEVRLYNSLGNEIVTLKNISLEELESKLLAYNSSSDTLTVSLKVEQDMQVGMVRDVKKVIRKAYGKMLKE